MAGVHAAEQRLHEAVDDLVAEPGGHQVADGHVVAGLAVGLGRCPGETLGAEHPARRELVEVERHPHQGARQVAEQPAGPDAGRGGGRMDDLGSELADQVDALGPAREHRLGADVDGEPGDLGGAQLAADLRGSLQEQHVATSGRKPAGGDQPGHSPTHDHCVPRHPVSLGCSVWTPT